jgi:hypothetical protein
MSSTKAFFFAAPPKTGFKVLALQSLSEYKYVYLVSCTHMKANITGLHVVNIKNIVEMYGFSLQSV